MSNFLFKYNKDDYFSPIISNDILKFFFNVNKMVDMSNLYMYLHVNFFSFDSNL